MNYQIWRDIKKESPCAFALAYAYYSGKDLMWLDGHGLVCLSPFADKRYLYDFFDEQHILIWCYPHVGTEYWWTYGIWQEGEPQTILEQCFAKCRNNIENEAFTHAFRLLEQTLTSVEP